MVFREGERETEGEREKGGGGGGCVRGWGRVEGVGSNMPLYHYREASHYLTSPCVFVTAHRQSSVELCESRGGRPGLPVHNSPYGPCGCKATLNKRTMQTDQSSGAV